MGKESWKTADIPNQTGRRAIVTGANSGIGFYTALELARSGAEVVMTSRDAAKGASARAQLLAEVPGAKVEVASLDLASLASVRRFATSQAGRPLDLLINNAGVMAPPQRKQTEDGFELQFGTNVLGHFALTALLLPALEAVSGPVAPRVVTVSSVAHKRGRMNFNDLQSVQTYDPKGAYNQSKLANLLFALEFDRRLRAGASRILSVAAHPGVANTNILLAGDFSPAMRTIRQVANAAVGILLNTPAGGALPSLYAATSPDALGGGYYGPQGLQELRGDDAGPAQIAPQAQNLADAAQLWTVSEQLTGLTLL